jgi:hypothetical protein
LDNSEQMNSGRETKAVAGAARPDAAFSRGSELDRILGLATRLSEFFHRHDNVAIFERDVRGRGEFESRSLGTDFFDRKAHGPITNGEV